ncbi:tetratricopeptide repeat protein, partial [uncultured Nostoc sp.]|uniref:tetratricopeptide repeat protein n=1 Tax=uncultured Nostoc sp. TaxID=340711 RepID=UPI0035CA197C
MRNNNEPDNHRVDIEEGNYNERIDGDYVQGRNNFLNNSFVLSLFERRSSNKGLTSPKSFRLRQTLLNQISLEVEKRMNSSLHKRVYISLDADQNPEQIQLPWSSEIKVENQQKIRLENTDIISIFDQTEIAGRLLILGQPGAGKTTILLKLASELLNRAKNELLYPVPVLFTLSSWKNDNQSIKDWLTDQLKDKYGVRTNIAKQWVSNEEIIPLLDGLDEVATERQEKCVIKINEFLNPKNWNNPVVICSRVEEYQRYTSLLQLNNSLELYPFSQTQVAEYLQKAGQLQLLDSITHDVNLSQLAKIPLLLNIIVLSSEEISVEMWQQFKSSEERLNYLFDAYIRRMFKRTYTGKNKQPKQENTQRWLSWLAYQLIEGSTTELLIEKIQPHWLKNNFQKLIYNLFVWGIIGLLINGLFWSIYGLLFSEKNQLIFGLFNGLIIGLITGLILGVFSEPFNLLIETNLFKYLIFSLNLFNKKTIKGITLGLISATIYIIYELILEFFLRLSHILINAPIPNKFSEICVGLIIGATYGLIGDTIQTIETIKFSFVNSLKGWREWLTIGLITGVITEIFIYINPTVINTISIENKVKFFIGSLILSLIIGLFFFSAGLLIGGLISGIDGIEIEEKTYANQGIWRSTINFCFLSLVISFFSTLIILLGQIIFKKIITSQIFIHSLLLGILFGNFIGIFRSGTPIIKHFILRVILWSNGYISWNYVKFLNYSTNRLFLQQVGGGYRFIHNLLRQHFANSYSQITLLPTYSHSPIVQRDKFKNILLIICVLVLMGYPFWQFNLRYIYTNAYNNRGNSYDNKKDYDRAIADYNLAIKLDPNYTFAYYNRGNSYDNKKDYDRAIADYNLAIKL